MKNNISMFICSALTVLQMGCHSTNKDAVASTVEGKEVQNQGVHIDYTDSRKGDTTLVFVHGWCINKSYWFDQIKFFQNRYRVVTVDLPGFGQSGKNRNIWTTQAYGSDIDTVLSQLNLHHVILIGHSMAGDIVLQAALQAPDRVIGLVGVDNFKSVGHTDTKEEKAGFEQAMSQMRHHFKETAFEFMNEALFYKTTADSIRQRILNDVSHADTVIAMAALMPSGFDEVAALTAVHKKLYIISSDVKPTDTTGLVAHQIPYQVLYIHATGHYPMIEKPGDFNTLLQQILQQ